MGRKLEIDAKGRRKAVEVVLAQMQKEYGGKHVINYLGKHPIEDCEALSMGVLGLDLILGIGGLPRGRITEIFGPESGGKTLLLLLAIAEAQRSNCECVFLDAENAFDAKFARALGVDTENLIVSQPDYAEQALEMIDNLVSANVVDMVVLDSIASLVPKVELEGKMGDQHVGLQAKLISQALRKLVGKVGRSRTAVIVSNQLRDKFNRSWWGPTEDTPGGRALKFYSSIRLRVDRLSGKTHQHIEGSIVYGHEVKVKCIKNKVAPPFGETSFMLYYRPHKNAGMNGQVGVGVDRISDLYSIATGCGTINPNSHKFGEVALGRKREDSMEKIRNDTALYHRIRQEVLKSYGIGER